LEKISDAAPVPFGHVEHEVKEFMRLWVRIMRRRAEASASELEAA